ncbi:uncharacterized protein PSANT_01067 [Moesziomyces antarcticus]|uniref:Uncharacterized protein n=1 Tax=Pseudozyma antarctica TaxID=84753 RepID=A0A5C3FG59_PSEA2|nr:uncharacterized protein PSANT_01067 [Moesziomyces antarcticus]
MHLGLSWRPTPNAFPITSAAHPKHQPNPPPPPAQPASLSPSTKSINPRSSLCTLSHVPPARRDGHR